MKKCQDCKFFNKRSVVKSDKGACCKYAPRPGGFASDMTSWPSVYTTDGCGEFEAVAVELPTTSSDEDGYTGA